jgi:hypothetical protein
MGRPLNLVKDWLTYTVKIALHGRKFYMAMLRKTSMPDHPEWAQRVLKKKQTGKQRAIDYRAAVIKRYYALQAHAPLKLDLEGAELFGVGMERLVGDG